MGVRNNNIEVSLWKCAYEALHRCLLSLDQQFVLNTQTNSAIDSDEINDGLSYTLSFDRASDSNDMTVDSFQCANLRIKESALITSTLLELIDVFRFLRISCVHSDQNQTHCRNVDLITLVRTFT